MLFCQIYQIMETLKLTLPTTCFSETTWLNQQLEKRAVSAQRLLKRFGFEKDYCILKMGQCLGGSYSTRICVVFCVKYLCAFVACAFNPLTTSVPHRIETSQLISSANQLTGS